MALSKTVTKFFPVKHSVADERSKMGIHLKLVDDSRPAAEQTVIERDFTAVYGGTHSLTQAKNAVIAEAQAAIDKYKAELALNNLAGYTNAVNDINNALIL
jgi:hypothetical protein